MNSSILYPPPKGEEGECGCLITSHRDFDRDRKRDFTRKLEAIWQPLWTYRTAGRTALSVTFFEEGVLEPFQWSGRAFPEYIRLIYPKKFTLWELELCLPLGPMSVIATSRLRFTVGEKWHLTVPWTLLHPRASAHGEPRFFFPLSTPLFLKSEQSFRLRMDWDMPLPEAVTIRAVLNGFLHREIP